MSRELLVHDVFGAPQGFVAALLASLISVITVLYIATKFGQIQSFREIALPFFVGLVTGMIGAVLALATQRALRRPPGDEARERQTHLPL